MTSIILEKYRKDVVPALKEKFGYKNVMSIPKIEKAVINIGVGRMSREKDTKGLERIEADLAKITGQKPSKRVAKKSISGFKLREGVMVGMAVTLRGKRMYDFIDRLISIALPRSRDFRGINPKSIDRNGNLNVGIKESNIFPEITYETLRDIFSFEVTFVTTAHSSQEGYELFKQIGFPLA